MFAPPWTKIQLSLLILLALITTVYALLLKGSFAFVDESIYYHIAYNLRHLHSFSVDGVKPTAIRPPGYPWLLASIQTLSESVRFARLCNLALWPACSLLTASIAGKLFGRLAITTALLLSVAYVVELYVAGTLYPQCFCSFLLLLSLWMHFVWRRSGQSTESVLQGLTWSMMVLAVPVFLVNLLLYAALLVFSKRRLQAVIVLAMVALPCAAWSARNAKIMHRPFISDNTGEMLLYGNSDQTGSNTGPQVPIWLIAPEGPKQQDELVAETIYQRTAVLWIRTHPKQAALLYIEKFANWFNCQLNLKTANETMSLYQLAIAVAYYPMLIACLASPWLLPAFRQLEVHFALHYLAAAAAYAVFFTRVRYRLPYDYLVLILSAGVCARFLESIIAAREARRSSEVVIASHNDSPTTRTYSCSEEIDAAAL